MLITLIHVSLTFKNELDIHLGTSFFSWSLTNPFCEDQGTLYRLIMQHAFNLRHTVETQYAKKKYEMKCLKMAFHSKSWQVYALAIQHRKEYFTQVSDDTQTLCL